MRLTHWNNHFNGILFLYQDLAASLARTMPKTKYTEQKTKYGNCTAFQFNGPDWGYWSTHKHIMYTRGLLLASFTCAIKINKTVEKPISATFNRRDDVFDLPFDSILASQIERKNCTVGIQNTYRRLQFI